MWWIAENEKLAYWSGGNLRPQKPEGFEEVQEQDGNLSWIPAAPPMPLPGKSLMTQWNEDEVPAEAQARAELDPLSKPIWEASASWGRYGDSFIGLIDLATWKIYIRPVFYIVHADPENRMSKATGFRTKSSSTLMDVTVVRNHYGPQNIVEVEWLDANNQGASHNTAVSKCGLYIDRVLGFGLSRGSGEQEYAEFLVASGRNLLTIGSGPRGGPLSGWGRRGTSAARHQAAVDLAEAMRLREEGYSPSEIKEALPFQFRKRRNRRFLPLAWRTWLYDFLRVKLPLEGNWRIDDRW